MVELDGLATVLAMVRNGHSVEELSVLADPSPLVVRARTDEVVDVGALRMALRAMPTVTVLAGDAPPDAAAAFDVCLATEAGATRPWVAASVEGVADAVAANPLAALALVALLRSAEGSDVWGGLAAESATYAALLGGAEFDAWLSTRAPRRVVEPASPRVRVARDGTTLRVVLDRPEAHNAFDRQMRDELVEALRLAAADEQISVVELTGSGPSFCSGGDLSEFGSVGDPPTAHAVRLTRHPAWWMHLSGDRIVARVHGACIGAGIELPAFAARVEATEEAFFALPEVGMGLIPGAGGTVSVNRRIGRQRCAWMALTGERIDAPTALEWGLVDAVRPLSLEDSPV